MTNSIYTTLYELIEQYIFGTVTPTTYQELVTIALSTIGCLFVFAIPFIVVWRVIRLVVG